jgi:aspartyl-tRNA(Asn)/glutamyl-tRNA(Gln) amidotransferase subunit C
MPEKNITIKEVAHVAKLARIATSESELAFYQGQLEKILGTFSTLQKTDTTDIPPTLHPYKTDTLLRDDVAVPFEKRADLFRNAPEMEETFYRVKKVIE